MNDSGRKTALCPWCDAPLLAVEETIVAPNPMRLKRCAACHKLISARSEGEPDEIIKK